MPIYEYQCGRCKKCFEVLEKIDSNSAKPCQHCEKGQARRVMSPSWFDLRGPGFYVNDKES